MICKLHFNVSYATRKIIKMVEKNSSGGDQSLIERGKNVKQNYQSSRVRFAPRQFLKLFIMICFPHIEILLIPCC